MIRTVALSLGALALAASGALARGQESARTGELRVRLECPEFFVPGERFEVEVELHALGGPVELESWQLTPSLFAVDGEKVASRADVHAITMAEDARFTLRFDLAPHLDVRRDFDLDCFGLRSLPEPIRYLEPAPAELDFMAIEAERLDDFLVLVRTNRGELLVEMWPHLAPNHVRNFLDLAHTGFYDRTTFHRVMAGFMIQGGDPVGNGSGTGPRTLQPEFSQQTHQRGVLSMARGPDPASASCQFFVMHADAPGLDGNYSVFGNLVAGFDTLDAIATAPGRFLSQGGDVRPSTDQIIERAVVVLADQPDSEIKR